MVRASGQRCRQPSRAAAYCLRKTPTTPTAFGLLVLSWVLVIPIPAMYPWPDAPVKTPLTMPVVLPVHPVVQLVPVNTWGPPFIDQVALDGMEYTVGVACNALVPKLSVMVEAGLICRALKSINRPLTPEKLPVRPKLSVGGVPPTKLYCAVPAPGKAMVGVSPKATWSPIRLKEPGTGGL